MPWIDNVNNLPPRERNIAKAVIEWGWYGLPESYDSLCKGHSAEQVAAIEAKFADARRRYLAVLYLHLDDTTVEDVFEIVAMLDEPPAHREVVSVMRTLDPLWK